MQILRARHNLGLGDHIICYGIVIELLTQYDYIILACKTHNMESVEFMYRGHNVLLISPDEMKEPCLNLHIRIKEFTKPLDRMFYERAGISFNKRFKAPKRNGARELSLMNKIHPPKPYKFIHDDLKRGMKIDDKYKKGNVVSPELGLTKNIFDYCKIIEEAEEVHCIESSFLLMIDYLGLRKVNAHRYARKLLPIEKPTYRNVNIIE